MKSWKKERYRRQKLFTAIKMRRNFGKEMKTLSQLIIADWRRQIRAQMEFLNEPKPRQLTTE